MNAVDLLQMIAEISRLGKTWVVATQWTVLCDQNAIILFPQLRPGGRRKVPSGSCCFYVATCQHVSSLARLLALFHDPHEKSLDFAVLWLESQSFSQILQCRSVLSAEKIKYDLYFNRYISILERLDDAVISTSGWRLGGPLFRVPPETNFSIMLMLLVKSELNFDQTLWSTVKYLQGIK